MPEAIPEPASTPVSTPPVARKPEDEFQAECRQNVAAAKELLGRILTPSETRALENTLVPYNHLLVHVQNAMAKSGLYANVHPDEAMRTAAETCEREVSAFVTDLKMNRPLYEALASLDLSKLDADARRFVERTLRDFRRAGVDKDEATRQRLKEIEDKLVEVGQAFDKNIRNDVRSVKLDPADLEGLPEDYKKAHPPGPDGKVTVNTDYPDYIPFRTYSKSAQARLATFKAFTTRGYPANAEVLKQIFALRKEKAKLLGYATYADYATEDKMVKSAKNVLDFIDKISKAADPRAKKDAALLLARKKKEIPGARTIDQSESYYYEELVRREKFKFDSQEVRPYFEFAQVRDGLLTITSKLFGVEYKAVEDEGAWHPDVYVYEVFQDNQKLGRIYLDMHPRDGKYKHAAQFTLVDGVEGLQLPEGVLVCNFPNPKKTDGPALMEHHDVVTMFHEFGHLMHHVLAGRQKWIYFSGVATEWDFVEAPSQMLEEWAWDTSTLQLFAKHYETKQPIPAELVKRMRTASEFGKGTQARHQMFYASMSVQYHLAAHPEKIDLQTLMTELQTKYSPYQYVPETHMYSSFGHLNGYASNYYTYMWSLVIAKDLFSAFEKSGLLDEATARKYRDKVLAPGGSQDAADLVKSFLGREYSFDSFKKWLDRT
ncbi:MAG: Zn-dependent oligopeptidase [Deltaproteobacteria bacterium]|nr:Zn-dependent oligopeptidase [Deltaproteobacteria bacterium]